LQKRNKIELLTHCDLDGIGCGVLINDSFPDANVHFCSHRDIDKNIQRITEDTILFIADIFPHEDKSIKHLNNMAVPIFFFDHHPGAVKELKRLYNVVQGSVVNLNYCAAVLLRNFLYRREDKFQELVHHINDFDANPNRNPNSIGFKLNLIMREIGIGKMYNMLKDQAAFHWRTDFDDILKIVNKKKNNVLKKAKEIEINNTHIIRNKNIVIFSDYQFIKFSNEIIERENNIDLYVFINDGELAFRKGQSYSIDCQKLAEHFNGGGHPYAAGAPKPDHLLNSPRDIVEDYLLNEIDTFLSTVQD